MDAFFRDDCRYERFEANPYSDQRDSLRVTFAEFVETFAPRQRRLTVLNRTAEDPILRMLERVFEGEPVTVRGAETADGAPENVLPLSLDDRLLGASNLSEVRDSLPLVNSDTYVTGTRGLEEVATPAVIANSDDVRFTVAGYPAHERQKMLLVEMSRSIEALARRVGSGVLRSGFQRLGRIDDEYGTYEAYEELAAANVVVHLYGTPDRTPPESFGTVHAHDHDELRESWFVTFEHPHDAALLAVETGSNEWDGFWTYRPDLVADIAAYAAETFP